MPDAHLSRFSINQVSVGITGMSNLNGRWEHHGVGTWTRPTEKLEDTYILVKKFPVNCGRCP
jgi:hypothetical protein